MVDVGVNEYVSSLEKLSKCRTEFSLHAKRPRRNKAFGAVKSSQALNSRLLE
jgi:hypothetical protein